MHNSPFTATGMKQYAVYRYLAQSFDGRIYYILMSYGMLEMLERLKGYEARKLNS